MKNYSCQLFMVEQIKRETNSNQFYCYGHKFPHSLKRPERTSELYLVISKLASLQKLSYQIVPSNQPCYPMPHFSSLVFTGKKGVSFSASVLIKYNQQGQLSTATSKSARSNYILNVHSLLFHQVFPHKFLKNLSQLHSISQRNFLVQKVFIQETFQFNRLLNFFIFKIMTLQNIVNFIYKVHIRTFCLLP